MSDPLATMAEIYRWLITEPHRSTRNNFACVARSDSHYRHKYPHTQRASILQPAAREIPARIQGELEKTYPWFYEHFYPGWGLKGQRT